MKKVLSLLLVMMLVFSLVACGDDDLIGKWEDEDGMQYEFTKDQMKVAGMSVDYSVDGNKMTISFMGEEETGLFKVKGDELYMYEDGQDYKDGEMLKKVD